MAGVLTAAIVLATAQAADAQTERLTTIRMRATGSMNVVWHGDPAAGCAAAGMCGYSGKTDYGPADSAFLERFSFGRDPIEFDGLLEMRRANTVRVRRSLAGSSFAECSDDGSSTALPPGFPAFPAAFVLRVRHAYRHRFRVTLGTDAVPLPIASGECAGPRLSDFVPSLPSAVFDPDRLMRRGARVSLAGRFPFQAGALTGEVVSNIVLHTRRVREERFHDHPGKTHTRRALAVFLDYDVTRVAGGVTADFRAVDSPACERFDACGTSGRDRYAVDAAGPKLRAFGIAPLGHRKVPPLREAIAMVARHGFFYASGSLRDDPGTSTSVLHRPGAGDCLDTFTPTGPLLSLVAGHGRLHLALGHEGGELIGGGVNVLRGRCPGPTQGEVLGRATLARSRISSRMLAREEFEAVLHGRGSFSKGAYSGTRRARVVVRLRRIHASVHAEREFVESAAAGRAQRP
ncbi:MAG: hypothetical protein QOG86_1348 [Thermoleophilaceae bacterium]|nr:hypothetical protein [Thermoleophilaceae bacterium]